ncbi:hypothetical protein [Enterococcus sp. DIV0170]|uniref:hypothetical protein n=1 Tax=Enterococcus sp. DIV0170 TaxID=2774642 RepID=UPI003F1F958F
MDINEIQKKIEETGYWDLLILDLEIKYFGDEIFLYIEKDKGACYRISFTSCYKLNYETDANWRGDFKVKNVGPSSGYYGQDISLEKYVETNESVKRSIEKSGGTDDFIKCSLDLSIMTMTIVCKNILVEEVKMEDTSFFWKEK